MVLHSVKKHQYGVKKRGEKNMKINATKLKFAMARKCMSSRDLAKSANVSYDSVVSFLSRRRDTTTKTLGKIAKALDVDPETLID